MAYERDETRRSGPGQPATGPRPFPDPAASGEDAKDPHSADRVRQGDVVLRKTWQKGVFLIGLFAGALVAIALIAWVVFL